MKRHVGATILICIIALNGYAQSSNDSNSAKPLEHQLKAIVAKDKGEGTDVKKLEDSCLELISKHNSPEDKGKIYAKIALMYSGAGYSSPNDMRIQKTAEYCRKALEYPLDPITTAEMYSRLAESQVAYKMTYGTNCSEQEFIKARHEAVINSLTGLKLVLDNNAPKEMTEHPPGGTLYNIRGDPNQEWYKKAKEEARKQQEQYIATRQKWNIKDRLCYLRQSFTGQCVMPYSHKPYNTSELEGLMREKLKGHEDAIDEILGKVNERIAKQENK